MKAVWSKIKLPLIKKKVVTIDIVYGINDDFPVSSYPPIENSLFGTVNLTKNTDIDRYKYSGYGIGFDRHWNFSFPGIEQQKVIPPISPLFYENCFLNKL